MAKALPILLLVLLFYKVPASAQTDSTKVEKEYYFNVHPYSTHLLDSTETKGLLISLEGFLNAHFKRVEPNPFIEPNYKNNKPGAFAWFTIDTSTYKPSLLSVLPIVEHKEFLITLSFISLSPEDKPQLGLNYSLTAKKLGEKVYFYNAIDYHTRNWNTQQVGSIKYIYPNQFNRKTAKKLDAFNRALAKKFDSKVAPVIYYKCEDPVQIFRIMGCDYTPNMYLSTYGGLAEAGNTIFAGNNSEWYPHEIVHLYINRYPNRIIQEGYATYLGGSGGIPLKELKVIATNYLKVNPHADLVQMFNDFHRVEKGIPFTYIASALICEEIESNKGFSGIKELLKAEAGEENYFRHLEKVTGVKKAEFSNYLKKLIL